MVPNANNVFNTVHEPLISISVYQVWDFTLQFTNSNRLNLSNQCFYSLSYLQICLPGLHISLGVFSSFLELFLDSSLVHEQQMAAKEAESEGNSGDTEYDECVRTLRKSVQERMSGDTYLAEAQALKDYATYIITLEGNDLSPTNLNPLSLQFLVHAQDLRKKAKEKVTVDFKKKIIIYCKRKYSAK